jgi:hypothetical protein
MVSRQAASYKGELTEMTRDEHLEWAKSRALEYLDRGDVQNAVTSMLSDMRKHPETHDHPGLELGARMLFAGLLSRDDQARDWINGFR